MLRVTKTATALVTVAFMAAGCAGSPGGVPVIDQQAAGAALGGVIGGIAGARFGEGQGKTAATIAGALIGAGVGAAIVQRLSEQGRLQAEATTQQTLSQARVGQTGRWEDPQTGIYGTVTPTTEVYRAPAPQPTYQAQPTYQTQPTYQSQGTYTAAPTYSQGTYAPAQPYPPYTTQPQTYATTSARECRDYETTVVAGGKPEILTGTMCRNGPNEPWRTAS